MICRSDRPVKPESAVKITEPAHERRPRGVCSSTVGPPLFVSSMLFAASHWCCFLRRLTLAFPSWLRRSSFVAPHCVGHAASSLRCSFLPLLRLYASFHALVRDTPKTCCIQDWMRPESQLLVHPRTTLGKEEVSRSQNYFLRTCSKPLADACFRAYPA